MELPTTKGDHKESGKGSKDSKSGQPHGKKGGKKSGKSTDLPLFESEGEMEFQDVNTKDPKKIKVETSGTESSSEEEQYQDQGGDILNDLMLQVAGTNAHSDAAAEQAQIGNINILNLPED